MNVLSRIPVWTNVFFLIPLIVALRFDLPFLALYIGLVTVVSTLYHIFREYGMSWLFLIFAIGDVLLAIILVMWGIGLLFASLPFDIFALAALIFFVLGMLAFRKQHHHESYHAYHGAWHLCASLGIAMCQLSFLLHH